MSRHSKNNNTRGFFTYEERVKLDYGTKRRRIGRDSLLNIFDCFICTSRVRDPMVCSKGHLSCRECLLNSLLSQACKKESSFTPHTDNPDTDNIKKQKDFIKTQKSITLLGNNLDSLVQEKKKNSFWVPQETPECTLVQHSEKKKRILCFYEKQGHETSLKKSFKVNFMEKESTFCCFTCKLYYAP